MPTSPFVQVQIAVSGGAQQQGGLTVAGASTIQLSVTNSSLLTSLRWEIYAYPNGWPTPAGWTLDGTTGIIYSTATTPPLITLEAATTRWGKWLVRAIGNGGTKNGVSPVFDPVTGAYLPNDVIDIASGWEVVSPSLGLHEPALFESTQFGGLRRWADPVQKSLHSLEQSGASAMRSVAQFGTVDPTGALDSSAAFQSAVNALAGTGVSLYIPAGTYKIGTRTTLPSNLQIIGTPNTTLKSAVAPVDGFSGSTWIAQTVQVTPANTGTLASTPTLGSRTLSCTMTAKPNVGNVLQVTNHLNGNDALEYDITAVSGVASPYTVTVDRPIARPFISTDVVTEMASCPRNILIDGNGMTFTGTGDRYIELAGAVGCRVRGVRFDGTTAAGTIASTAASFDVGGRENVFENCWVNLTGIGAGIGLGLILESNEHSRVVGCNVLGCNNGGIIIYDGTYCEISGCHAANGAGSAYGFGIQNDGASTYGNIDCVISNSTATDCPTGFGAGATVRTRVQGCTFARCVTGMQTGGGILLAENVSCPNCTTQGVNVQSGAPLKAQNLNCDGSSQGIVAADSFDVDGFSCIGHTQTGVMGTAGAVARVTHFDMSTAGAYGAFDMTTTRTELAHGKCSTAGVQGIIVEPAKILTIHDVVVSGATLRAVYCQGTVREGVGCDFSGSTAGVVLAASSYASRKQTVVANGVTGVAVAWPDIKASDVVAFTLQVIGGTVGHPKYTITPGTGFTFTSDAADTSTYEYEVR